jgi:methionyl-tRNA formyltransferase
VIYIKFVRTIYRYENRFFGTTDFAVASLEALKHSSHDVVAVVTNIDTFGGRGRKEIIKSAVSLFSEEHHIPTFKPKSLKSSKFITTLAELKADIFVVVAFRMLPEMVVLPPKGTINVHGSILPAYRGAAPINWAIIKGEAVTGVKHISVGSCH